MADEANPMSLTNRLRTLRQKWYKMEVRSPVWAETWSILDVLAQDFDSRLDWQEKARSELERTTAAAASLARPLPVEMSSIRTDWKPSVPAARSPSPRVCEPVEVVGGFVVDEPPRTPFAEDARQSPFVDSSSDDEGEQSAPVSVQAKSSKPRVGSWSVDGGPAPNPAKQQKEIAREAKKVAKSMGEAAQREITSRVMTSSSRVADGEPRQRPSYGVADDEATEALRTVARRGQPASFDIHLHVNN